jgi:FHS family glucose/mannose:H+ symporter-like MFS transporter
MIQKLHWPYIIISYFSLLAFGLIDNARGPFFPEIIKDLALKDSEASWFFASTSFMALLGSFFAPRVQQFTGSLWGLRIGLFLITLGFSLLSLSSNIFVLILFCSILGLGMGLSQVFEHTCIQEGSAPTVRRRLFNGLHSFYALASLFAPLSAGFLLNLNWDWRKSFLLLSALPLVTFIFSLFIKNQNHKFELNENSKASGFELKHMIYIGLIQALYVTAEITIGTRLVLLIQRTTSLSPAQSTIYLSVFFGLLLLGRVFFTYFDFKAFSNRVILLTSLIVSGLLYSMGLKFNPWLISFCGLTMAPIFAVSMDFLTQNFKEKSTQAISLSFTIGAIFIVSMHSLIGIISEKWDIQTALWMGPVFLFSSALLLYFEKIIFRNVRKSIDF